MELRNNIKCELCGTSIFSNINHKNNVYVYCSNCDVEILVDKLSEEEEAQLYSEKYYSSWGHDENVKAEDLSYWSLKRNFFARIINNSYGQQQPGVKALDLGCATGACLSVFPDFGLVPYGIDVNPFAISAARKNVPEAHLFNGYFEDRPDGMDEFSLVILSDVIEHVHDPVVLLKSIYDSMLPGGRLILVTPNIKSFSKNMMGRKWPHYKPEHVLLYGQTGLTKILTAARFQSVSFKRAVKTLSISYGLNYYRNYGSPWVSKICSILLNITPKIIANAPISFSIGETEVSCSKPIS